MGQIWEYKKIPCELSIEVMDSLGLKGWENYWNTIDPYGRIDTMFWKRLIK